MMYQRQAVIIIAFVALAICLAVFFVWPAFNFVKNASEDIIAKKARIIFLKDQEEASQIFQKNYRRYQVGLEAVDHLFADKKNPIGLIEFIELTAQEAGTQIQIHLSPLEEKAVSGRTSIFFDLMAQGSFSALQAFTQALENGPYLIAIQKVTMKKLSAEIKEKVASSNLLQANFSLAIIAK